ncbi:hypothetical protein Q7C36_002984 [Tachysurus vachellii]|uniref:Cilia- and flagella-associated protein 58 central coiled coil domain-containing protein n=1 Tax=Tachysurus vachellii TaxID=175792 RepID=A0AA88NT67_TACVA|nr:hypothetical protein Q7C36_002984 [Tachysurus vachellii]
MYKKKIDELFKEKDMLNKKLIKAANATEKQLNLVMQHKQLKKKLELDILNHQHEAQKQRNIIFHLSMERDHYMNKASELTQKGLSHMEDLKVGQIKIFEYKKKIAEAETKLNRLQNQYEAIRAERDKFSKNLLDAQHDITAMKRKIKSMTQETVQLTEEFKSKEAALVKEHLDFLRIEKVKEALKVELQKIKKQVQETKQLINKQKTEEKKLLKIIADAAAEKVQQKKELKQVIRERDILRTQLVTPMEQLSSLYEEDKIQQSILNNCNIQYNQIVEDIRLLTYDIKKLLGDKTVLNRIVFNVDDLRNEVRHIQKELLKERARCKSLQEELENSMHHYFWRGLEGSDRWKIELIQKTQYLMQGLIDKTKMVAEKEFLLKEKEKEYNELKQKLACMPGQKAAEQLRKIQHTLDQKNKLLMEKEKECIELNQKLACKSGQKAADKLWIIQQTLKDMNKQFKVFSVEVNMYKSQAMEYKKQIEQLNEELKDVKKKYFVLKRKDQKEQERSLAQGWQPATVRRRADGPGL